MSQGEPQEGPIGEKEPVTQDTLTKIVAVAVEKTKDVKPRSGIHPNYHKAPQMRITSQTRVDSEGVAEEGFRVTTYDETNRPILEGMPLLARITVTEIHGGDRTPTQALYSIAQSEKGLKLLKREREVGVSQKALKDGIITIVEQKPPLADMQSITPDIHTGYASPGDALPPDFYREFEMAGPGSLLITEDEKLEDKLGMGVVPEAEAERLLAKLSAS